MNNIQEGDELVIAYHRNYNVSKRKAYLSDAYGFNCSCEMCLIQEFSTKFYLKYVWFKFKHFLMNIRYTIVGYYTKRWIKNHLD
jgi:hypothetical protein